MIAFEAPPAPANQAAIVAANLSRRAQQAA
jgi:hypothetical protein